MWSIYMCLNAQCFIFVFCRVFLKRYLSIWQLFGDRGAGGDVIGGDYSFEGSLLEYLTDCCKSNMMAFDVNGKGGEDSCMIKKSLLDNFIISMKYEINWFFTNKLKRRSHFLVIKFCWVRQSLLAITAWLLFIIIFVVIHAIKI